MFHSITFTWTWANTMVLERLWTLQKKTSSKFYTKFNKTQLNFIVISATYSDTIQHFSRTMVLHTKPEHRIAAKCMQAI